jgi:hypothetical protein
MGNEDNQPGFCDYGGEPFGFIKTLRLSYKAQPVNAVWGNSRCLL